LHLNDRLSEKRSSILEKWFDTLLRAYPADSSGFLRQQKKRFANPVGYTLSQGLEKILGGLLGGAALGEITPSLEDIIRIRALQGSNPSQDLAFLFHLKEVIREELKGDGTVVSAELQALDDRIDALALIAFDLYMKCREKIYELKANEVKNRTYRLLQRANLICEAPEE